jgi:hypothetical protein
LLVHAYAKTRQDDLSESEKKAIQSVIKEIETLLQQRKGPN